MKGLLHVVALLPLWTSCFWIPSCHAQAACSPPREVDMPRSVRTRWSEVFTADERCLICTYWYAGAALDEPSNEAFKREVACTFSCPEEFIPRWSILSGGWLEFWRTWRVDDTCNGGRRGDCDFFHPGATNCVLSRESTLNGHGQQCCFDGDRALITTGPGGGGTADFSTGDSNWETDIIPFLCTVDFPDEFSQDRYFELRPVQNATSRPDDCEETTSEPTSSPTLAPFSPSPPVPTQTPTRNPSGTSTPTFAPSSSPVSPPTLPTEELCVAAPPPDDIPFYYDYTWYQLSSWVRCQTCIVAADNARRSIGSDLLERFIHEVNCECPCPPLYTVEGVWSIDDGCNGLGLPLDACDFNHPGALTCIRSIPTSSGHGQQCCYNELGILITSSGAGGSIDFVHSSDSVGHFTLDVIPYLCTIDFPHIYPPDLYFTIRPTSGHQRPIDCGPSGGSSGDPHISTFDGLRFGCQVKGELVLAKSLNDTIMPLSIHSRSFQSVRRRQVTSNKGVAARVGLAPVIEVVSPLEWSPADDVDFLFGFCPVMMFVNSTRYRLQDGYVDHHVEVGRISTGQLRIFFYGAGVEILVSANRNAALGCYFNLYVSIAEGPLRDVVVGVLGSPDNNPYNDWTTSDGTPLSFRRGVSNSYCSSSWCVANREDSLFSYNDGFDFNVDCVWSASDGGSVNPRDASSELRELCGSNEACLIDGIALGMDDAISTLAFEAHLAEARSATGRLSFVPTSVQAVVPTNVTVTVDVRDFDIPVFYPTLDGFQLYEVNETGRIGTMPVTALDEMSPGIYQGTIGITAPNGGEVYGYQALPVLANATVFDSELIQTAISAVISSTPRPPTPQPSAIPSMDPTTTVKPSDEALSVHPSNRPSHLPSEFTRESEKPSTAPESVQSNRPSISPMPSSASSFVPSGLLSRSPSRTPTSEPSWSPSRYPSEAPSSGPSRAPTSAPSLTASAAPTAQRCFSSTSELQQAVDIYVLDNSSDSLAARTYGWPIGSWCVDYIDDFSELFSDERDATTSTFNEDISGWNMSSASNLATMFHGSQFNQPLADWDVSKVTTMQGCFRLSNFNQPIEAWDTGNVQDMILMFEASAFNQTLSAWNVSSLQSALGMFSGSIYNYSLSAWDMSSAEDLTGMFFNSAFNHPLDDWDVGNVVNAAQMFAESDFRQDLCAWGERLSSVISVEDMFRSTTCPNTEDPDLDASPPGPFCFPC